MSQTCRSRKFVNGFVLGALWLFCLLSIQLQAVYAAPVWRTPHYSAELGVECMHGCKFGHPGSHFHSNSTTSDFLITSNQGEPIRLPELSAGHFLVIPIAAFAALIYHTFKIKSGKPM